MTSNLRPPGRTFDRLQRLSHARPVESNARPVPQPRYESSVHIARSTFAAVLVAALAACSHEMPREPEQRAKPAAQEDPWRVQGSVTAGPMSGAPQGPYGARP